MEYFNHLDSLLRTFWLIALPASLIFLIQMILTFVGTDAFDGVDADFDGDLDAGDTPFQLFSFRNLINFMLGFGWSGVSLFETIHNHTMLVTVSVLIGIGFVALFFLTMKQIHKLAEDNTFQLSTTVDKTADVYLSIPEGKNGSGKVLISIKGSVHELPAITEGPRIETGAIVKVIRLENNLLVVEKI